MAKNKHGKLRDAIETLVKAHEAFQDDVERTANCIQLHFHELAVIAGDRPRMSVRSLRAMAISAIMGLRYLAPIRHLQTAARSMPVIAAVVTSPGIPRSAMVVATGDGKWLVPWGVNVLQPQDHVRGQKQFRRRSLLYCPDSSEFGKDRAWFKEDDRSDSLTSQVLSIAEHCHSKDHQSACRLRANLLQEAHTVFVEALIAWRRNPGGDTLPESNDSLFKLPFTPAPGESLAQAWEKSRQYSRGRRRHRRGLNSRFRILLERTIFKGVGWSDERQRAFILEWERKLLGPTDTCPRADGITQGKAIDQDRGYLFLRFFIDAFLADSAEKRCGEIVCILWICIWMGAVQADIDLKEILGLTSQQLSAPAEPPSLLIQGKRWEISGGLHQLLMILRGEGLGRHACRLFTNTSVDTLEKELKRASAILLPGQLPVAPSAFLLFPHPWPNQRVGKKQRLAMRRSATSG